MSVRPLRCWSRFPAGASVLLLAALGIAPAQAQTSFGTIVVFGESYADRGNVSCFNANGFANCPYPRQTPFPGNPPVGDTQIVPFSYQLQQLYGISNSAAADYAIAGSTAYSGSNGKSETQQINDFIASGRRLGPGDLVAVQFIGNDGFFSALAGVNGVNLFPAFVTGNPVTDAKNEAARDITNFQKLVNAGLRTIAWLAPGDVANKPIGLSGPFSSPAFQAHFHSYYNTAFDALQTGLSPFAHAGIRIFLFDLRILESRLLNTPQMYGYTNINQAFRIPQGDGLHYNAAGFQLIARYMQNQLDAPNTVFPQGDVALGMVSTFSNSIFNRLDAYRAFSSFGSSAAVFATPMMGLGGPSSSLKDPYALTPSRWSTWAEGNYASGSGDKQFYANAFDYQAAGISSGFEYRASPNARMGLAISYANPDVDLGNNSGHYDINSYQLAAYASFVSRQWFTDAVLAYGRHNYDLDRPGIIDTIRAKTHADTFAAAVKAGYLFDIGPLRVGPIAGLNYVNARIAGYTETGDILITQIVDSQDIDSLTGSAGVQLRFPFAMGAGLYSPFVNVTAEHDFLGSGRTITTTQLTTPLLPVLTPSDDRDRTYGRVTGGVAANLGANMDAMLNASTTFARDGGNEFAINGGLRFRF